MGKKPPPPPPPPDLAPIVLGKDKPLTVTPEVQAAWDKTVATFADPKKKSEFAIKFSQYILVRLDHLARTTTSPKVLQDVARIGRDYVEFAFKEAK